MTQGIRSRRRGTHDDDSGAAMLEFVTLVVVLMLPLTYLVLTVFAVQRAAYAAGAASRESARVFVLAASSTSGAADATAATQIVVSDHGLSTQDASLSLVCSADPCLTPGARVSAVVDAEVALPLVPAFLSDLVPLAVPIHAEHTQVVDRYSALRP